MQLNSKIDIRASGGVEPLRQIYVMTPEERQGGQGISWFVPNFTAAASSTRTIRRFDEFMAQAERLSSFTLRSRSSAARSSTIRSRRLGCVLMQLTERIELALALVATSPRLAYDIETTGSRIDARVVGYAVSDGRVAVYVPVRHRQATSNLPGELRERLALAFRERTRRGFLTIGFNIGFDLFHAGRYGVWPGAPLEDAQINEVLIYEYHRAYDLQACLDRRGLPGKDDEALLHELARHFGGARTRRVQMRNFWRLPGDEPAGLGLRDLGRTRHLCSVGRAAGGDRRT